MTPSYEDTEVLAESLAKLILIIKKKIKSFLSSFNFYKKPEQS